MPTIKQWYKLAIVMLVITGISAGVSLTRLVMHIYYTINGVG